MRMTDRTPPPPPADPKTPGWPWLRDRLRRHIPELLRLAWPVVIARVGIITLQVVDTVMVGRFDSTELSYLAIANVPAQWLLVATLGLLIGTMVVASNAVGSDQPHRAGQAWRRSIPYALWLGVGVAVLCAFGTPFLRLTGQPADLVAGGGPLIAILGLGIGANLVFITSALFLEGIRRPAVGMVVMVIGNLVNIAANWVLIYGNLGIPALGAEGSAWATTLVRLVMAGSVVAYIWWLLPDRDRYAVRVKPRGGWRAWAQQRRFGYAAGLSNAMESGAFALVGLMAGWLGSLAVGAYAITFNILATSYMVALGIASATAVRVGNAHGRQDTTDLALAGWIGLTVNTLLVGAIALVLQIVNTRIAQAYTVDPALVIMAAPLIAFAATILIADGGQSVMLHALRGRGETWVPTLLHFVSYFAVQIPLAYLLAFPAGRGVQGLLEGILIASVISLTALALRFRWLGRRDARAWDGRIAPT